MQIIPVIFLKIKTYREITDLSFHTGPSFLFSIFYILYQFTKLKKLHYSNEYSVVFFNRQLFFGGLVFLVGIFIPFMSRMSTFFIIFLFYDVAINNYFKNFMINKNAVFKFIMVFMFSFFSMASYFKNDIAPVSFNNMNFNLISFLSNNVNYDALVYEAYYKNALTTSEHTSGK